MRRIFVSQRVEIVPDYAERRDALDQRWSPFLHETGGLLFPVPNNIEVLQKVLQLTPPDGILLTGGNSPAKYGGNAPERDITDNVLLDYAISHKTPLIGVCRGMQSVLLHFGAKLHRIDAHVAIRHEIKGQIQRNVNSYHELAAYNIPEPLMVLAAAEDGVIEGVRHKELPIMAIMWHPEREAIFSPDDVDLFTIHWNAEV